MFFFKKHYKMLCYFLYDTIFQDYFDTILTILVTSFLESPLQNIKKNGEAHEFDYNEIDCLFSIHLQKISVNMTGGACFTTWYIYCYNLCF